MAGVLEPVEEGLIRKHLPDHGILDVLTKWGCRW
jgi:hypothetical protein